jgi:outer membrane protein OmpA-like peptidoglycan-associated protein
MPSQNVGSAVVQDVSVNSGSAKNLKIRLILTAVMLPVMYLLCGAALAADVPGSKDSPLLKRYEGSQIIGYDYRGFDQFHLITGPLKSYDLPPDPSTKTMGKHTRILYVAPPERSPLEVFHNYAMELEQGGYETVFTCSEAECGKANALPRTLYHRDRKLSNKGQMSEYAFSSPVEPQFLAATLRRPEGDVHVSLYVAKETFKHFQETSQRTLVLLDIVETAPMEKKMVTVDAGAMAKSIAAQGTIALYGIYFDTDRAELKPESAPTLDEIAKLLQGDPGLKLYVVGHTDGVGGFDYNMELSKKRAQAVVRELTEKYGIAEGRLKGAGVGFLAPVGSNEDEEGRAKNRRVELVKDGN